MEQQTQGTVAQPPRRQAQFVAQLGLCCAERAFWAGNQAGEETKPYFHHREGD